MQESEARGGVYRFALPMLLLIALGLRIWAWPAQFRDMDEIGYEFSSLMLFEGMTPAFKAAPAGPQIWTGWAYLAGRSALHFISPPPGVRVPTLFRPYEAADQAVFETYLRPEPLWRLLVGLNVVLLLGAVWAAFKLGMSLAGPAGAVVLGGYFACSQLAVSFSLMSRPYSAAWSFAVCGLYLATRPSRRSVTVSAILIGMACSSRIDALLIVPVYLLILRRSGIGASGWRCAGVACATLLITAPWLTTNLLTNLKSIVAVKLVGVSGGTNIVGQTMLQLFWYQGVGLVIVLGLVALAAGAVRRVFSVRTTITLGLAMLLYGVSLLKSTGYGIHHEGISIVALLVLACMAGGPFLGAIARSRRGFWAPGLAAALVLLMFAQTTLNAGWRRPWIPEASRVSQWINERVPAGTTVYLPGEFISYASLLPTPESATALWSQAVGPDWDKKMMWTMSRIGSDSPRLTRTLSFDTAIKEISYVRRLFVLGGRPETPGRRYDIRLYQLFFLETGELDRVEQALRDEACVVVLHATDPTAPEPARLANIASVQSFPDQDGGAWLVLESRKLDPPATRPGG